MGKQTKTTPAALLAVGIALLLAGFTGCGGSNTSSTTQATQAASTPTSTPATSSTSASTPPPSSSSGAGTTTGSQAQPPAEAETPTQEKVEISSPVVRSEGLLPARYTCDGQNTPLPLRWEGIPPGTQGLLLDILKVNPVNGQLFFDWALSLKPDSHGVDPGKLPAGTIVGANSLGHAGYSLCPPKGHTEQYVAVLFALTRKLPAKNAFDASRLRLKALHDSKYEGFLFFNYKHH
jgi:phosphatidylethanolamine-binding protein (PEBP) family uncharacterized protein